MMKEEWLANHSEQHPSLPACLQPAHQQTRTTTRNGLPEMMHKKRDESRTKTEDNGCLFVQ